MVWVCPRTGEVRRGALDEPVVTVYTSPSDLVSHTAVRARSNSMEAKGEKVQWKWVEEADLTAEQKQKMTDSSTSQ
ncbi:hypothetical protein DIPPA_21525 [Diplonema papillatum]|nr:hypothetical protein DIPPA_21525 [Diplonema papillatum]